ncbi:phage holin family protein [Streptantibioticus rubrisoli]|uniref:Phage holin family protein n=1 Tax=Streptantibioticus rubrisoli TaxID=1387313 RepID=A0ABT1P9Q5_9ACTN|nr:phage holin family protein [Streptantibioticus rubrisoli]MCQ4042101.1 phage holin family protein [Streptantibioticus rubrisoli]
MKKFLVKTLANAVALGVAVWLIKGITLTGSSTAHKALTLVLVALVFGVVNWLVKPVVKLLSLPLFILTLGLFTLVVNALMLMLTSYLSNKLSLNFHVSGFWAAFVGGLVVSIVAWAMHLVLPDEDDRR